MQKKRLSNIELLRIISMFFIMIGHSYIRSEGLPSSEEVNFHPISSFFICIVNAIIVDGVNIFVLISGWFGIKFSKNNLAKYLYQVFFLFILLYLLALISNKASMSITDIKNVLGLTSGYWFITAYLGLFILSPILNKFSENATKQQFTYTLVCLFGFQCFYSWLTSYVDYYGGYSIILLTSIYLLGRYLRLYPIQMLEDKAVLFYIVTIFLIAIIVELGLGKVGNALRMLRYDSPLVILSSVSLLLSINKIKFQSKFINLLASASFAVYIIHFNPYVYPYFRTGEMLLFKSYNSISYVLFFLIFLSIVYIVCFFIDRIRYFTWNLFHQIHKQKTR